MKRTTKLGKGPATRTLRLHGETVKKLTALNEVQLQHAVGGTIIHSLDDFCYEDPGITIYCPA
jgi:hypothetical protein